MASIFQYTPGEGANNRNSPDGWKEGMDRPGVNNSDRTFAAAVRTWADDPEWLDIMRDPIGDSLTVSRDSGTVVRVAARNMALFFITDRRIKVSGGGTKEGKVVSAVFSSPDTLVTVDIDGSDTVPVGTDKIELYFARTLQAQVEQVFSPDVVIIQSF